VRINGAHIKKLIWLSSCFLISLFIVFSVPSLRRYGRTCERTPRTWDGNAGSTPASRTNTKLKIHIMDNNLNGTQTASQESRIKWWFLNNPEKEITSLEALRMFDCLEFPKRISNLVAQGLPISRDRTIQVRNNKRVKAYYITKSAAAEYMKQNNIKILNN